MPVTSKRAALIALLVSTTVSWTTLPAVETECQVAASPILPAGITNDTHATYLSALVESALSSGVENLKCIQGALEKRDLTDAERQLLEKAYEAQVSAMRAIADRWNGLYTSHAKRKARN